MIETLKYVVSFNTTGRTLKNHLRFKPGITVIKGENESGKSFVLEMIRYALFGAEALRGLRTDYDKLDVTLTITVKDKLYTIIRKDNRATVNINEAVGTTAVNKYIIKILGFGLAVFDISANAMQGELDKLTKDLTATQRRKIIDDVTGLSLFEAAEKDCREEANTFRKISEALEAQLVEPVGPVKPDDYEESTVLKLRLDEEIKNRTIRASFIHMDKPVLPENPLGNPDCLAHEQERLADLKQRLSLQQQLDRLPQVDEDYDEQTLRRYKAALEQSALGPLPSGYNESELLQWQEDHIILQREDGPLICGNCGEIVRGKALPLVPKLSRAEITDELTRLRRWQGRTFDSNLDDSPLTDSDISDRLDAIANAPKSAIIRSQILGLGPELTDRSEEAAAWRAYQADMEAWVYRENDYGKWLERKAVVDALPEPETYLTERYEMALRYETLQAKHETAMEIYTNQLERLEAARLKRDGFKRGSDALKDARKEIKRYLVPSLSRVASALLVEMTDGQRRTIKIDEDFEIWVDRQHVRTLSGSGVSVVNLALRIALGQVLTQSVIPFFLADEIDANMAAKRTKATHDSLKRLKSKLKQIIVVTHKEFEGDHTICLS